MGRTITIITWLLLGLFYWWFHEQCCDVTAPGGEESVQDESLEKPIPTPPEGPLIGQFGSPDMITSDETSDYFQQAVDKMKEDQVMEVIARYSSSESNRTSFENLGVARANQVKSLLSEYMDTMGVAVVGQSVNSLDTVAGGYFEPIELKYKNKPVQLTEIPDRTLIYFSYNSTEQIEDKEIENYLKDVAERVKKTGETVSLVGHTDSFGDASYNYNLGLSRAKMVQRYLRRLGVPSSQITIDSKGEVSPIAPNSTDEGRSKNRRTELIIE